MSIIFFIIAVVVSLPVAAIVLVSVASRREDHRFSLGGPADGRVQQAARRIVDFRTETGAVWSPAASPSRSVAEPEREPVSAGRPRKRIDSPLMATRMVSFRQAA
jgi:hypothetical protein